MDAIDHKIIALLQENAETPIQVIADQVQPVYDALLATHTEAFKETGVIQKQVALCDPAALNVGVTVFIAVRTNQHSQAWLDRFAKHVADIPEVLEFYRMSGEVDYLIRVVVPDIATYDKVYKKLIRIADLYDVSSSFAMEQIKYTTALPIDYV